MQVEYLANQCNENFQKTKQFDPETYADEYLNFVGKIYGERLKLSGGEIKDFVTSAKALKDRTTIFTVTNKHLKKVDNTFTGGISVVTTKGPKDLLPLEKATGFRVPHIQGETLYELSRLSVEKGSDPGLFKELLGQTLGYMKANCRFN